MKRPAIRAPEVASRMAKRLVPLAARFGLDGETLCRRHGLPRELLEDARGRVPLASTLDVLEELLEKAGSTTLGLSMAGIHEPETYDTPALILLASDCLERGFARAFRYQRLWGDGERFALSSPAELGLSLPGSAVTFRLPVPRRPAIAVLEVCALAETMTAVRMLTGRTGERALALGLPDCPDDAGVVTSYFGVEPQRDAATAFVVIADAALKAPLPNANELFCSIFEWQASAELARMPQPDDILRRVRAHIARGLAQGELGLARAAGLLGFGRRTLERRLAEHGTSYSELVDEVRREQAQRLLAQGRAIDDIVLLLGYSERSAFHRACLRWFGKTPASLRNSGKAAAR